MVMYFGCHVQKYCDHNPFDFVLMSVIDCKAILRDAALYSPYLLIFRWGWALAATDAAISKGEIKGRLSLSAKSKIYSDSQGGVSNKQDFKHAWIKNELQHWVMLTISNSMQWVTVHHIQEDRIQTLQKMWTDDKLLNRYNVMFMKVAWKLKLEDLCDLIM